MPFRPRLSLLPRRRRRHPLSLAHVRGLLFSSHAAAATESEEDTVVGRDAPLPPPRPPAAGGGAGFGRQVGHDNGELERKALIAERYRLCHELLWQRRWRDMRHCLAELVSEQGSDSAPILCGILWNGFREWDLNVNVWDALANSYIRSQMIRDALYVLNQMNSLNVQISVSTYDSLLYSLRKTDLALKIYEEMESCGVSPSNYSHSIVIDGLCKQDKVAEALSFLQEVRKGGMFKPLGMTFNIFMSALCKRGFIQSAKSFSGLMLKYGLNPDKYMYSTLIHGLCKVGSLEEAYRIYDRVTKEGMELDIVTYNSLINGCRLLGLTREIPNIIKMMRYQGIEPDLITYTILIAAHCEGGDVEEGLKIRKEILDQGLQLNIVTYSVLINALFKKGLFYEVENLLGEMCSIGLDMDAVAYSILIHGYCKLGQIRRALEVCNAMCDSQRIMPTSLNHLSILLGLCKNRLLVEARWYLKNVATKYQPNDVAVYNVVIDGYAKMGDISNAVELYDQIVLNENLLELLRGTDTKLRTFAYTTLIKAQCAKGMPYKAIKWIGKLINADFEPSIEDFSAVINRLCKRDFAEEAFMFIHIMTSVFFFEIIL